MKRNITVAVLFGLFTVLHLGCERAEVSTSEESGSGKTDSVHDAKPIRVMTWNVGRYYLDEFIEGWQSKAADASLPQIADTIRRWQADLVTLQEIADVSQLDTLLESLGSDWRGRVAYDSYGRYTALLTRLPLKGFFRHETGTGRTFQGAIVYMGGQEVVTVAIHLDSSSAERRWVQLAQLRKDLSAHQHVILAGDFNFDIGRAFLPREDRASYELLTDDWRMVDAAKGFYTSVLEQRLDYVFYRGHGLVDQRPAIIPEDRVPGGDHNAVIVNLSAGDFS